MCTPIVLKELIWDYAFENRFRQGWREVEMLIEFRDRVPPCLCACECFHERTQLFVLNPYRRGTPYLPLSSIYFNPWGGLRHWLARYVPPDKIRTGMRTYPRVFQRHACVREISKWNRMLKYLLRLRPEHAPDPPRREKFLAAIAQIGEAMPLSPTCAQFPWPGSLASEHARF